MRRQMGNEILALSVLAWKYFKLNLKTALEYKFDRVSSIIAIFCREIISVAIIYLILTRFVRIKGWELNELFFLYSFLFLSYSLLVFFFSGIRDFDELVYSGEFDRFLLRPVGLMFQVIASRVDHCAILGHGAVGILLFIYTVRSVGIEWSAGNVAYYVTALVGGAVIQASIFMVSSCFSFFAIRTTNLRNMVFFNSRRFAGYPISFYPGIIQKMLIFLVPFAFVNFFPAQYFLRKADLSMFWDGFLYLTPVVGIVMFVMVYAFWRFGLRHYSSSGNSMY